ncbi:hypothetical protein GGR56DRAFT_578125 [Xylariaceae sp. FL0804]|nr:hypothetical protein GGR56DRAFT_578125 [Xylariaceae sp. FL0804]
MPAPKPELRVRRYHSRSRNGCTTCKLKHIRCDEKRPLWSKSHLQLTLGNLGRSTNCLLKGGQCGYTSPEPETPPEASTHSGGESSVWSAAKRAVVDTSSAPLFTGHPSPMIDESRFLFDSRSMEVWSRKMRPRRPSHSSSGVRCQVRQT